jgi:CheY-like chemotaxis protein
MPFAIDPVPNPRRILIIDDSRDAAHTLKMLLGKVGHQVEVVTDGASGIETARRSAPEIIFCDIGMPGMDGYQVAAALRADETTRNAYLVALTGYGQDDDQTKALQSGFDKHLTKPVGWSTLQSIIAEVPLQQDTGG